MKEKIKIAFSDFWGGFEYNPINKSNFDNTIYRILTERFDIEISDNPDILIYSVFGKNHQKYNCRKIMYTGENIRSDLNYCDYSITFDYMDNDRNLRFPLSAITLYENGIIDDFEKEIDFEKIKHQKVNFCNFIFSNPSANYRNQLFRELSKYKKVDSGGRAFNNIGFYVKDKLEFQNMYKFSISFENSEFPGYTTEKIVHPKIVNSIPIYWGNPLVHNDWNTKSFINSYNFGSIKQLVEYIIEVDNNDKLYFEMLNQSHFNNPKSKDLKHTTLLDFFEKIIKDI